MDDGSNTDDEYLSWKESTVENTDTPQTVNSSQEEQSYEANEDTETGGGEQLKQNGPTVQRESSTPEATGKIAFSVSEQVPQQDVMAIQEANPKVPFH